MVVLYAATSMVLVIRHMTSFRKVRESHVNCNYCEEHLATQKHLFEHFDFDEDLMDIEDGHFYADGEEEEEDEDENGFLEEDYCFPSEDEVEEEIEGKQIEEEIEVDIEDEEEEEEEEVEEVEDLEEVDESD